MLNQKQQGRLDGFFKVTPKDKPTAASAKNAKDTKTTGKRKVGGASRRIRVATNSFPYRLARRKSLELRRQRARSS